MKLFDYNFRQFMHIVRIIIRELRGSKLEPEVPFMDRFLSPAANCVHDGAACKTLIDSERRKNAQASNDVRARQLARF